MVKVSGDNQRGAPGETLPALLTVQVNDVDGSGMSGVRVDFEVTSGDARLDHDHATTDALGRARVRVTLRDSLGVVEVAAGVEGLEWFVGSDLSQWELQLAGRRGQGRCRLQPSLDPPGLALSISPVWNEDAATALPGTGAVRRSR